MGATPTAVGINAVTCEAQVAWAMVDNQDSTHTGTLPAGTDIQQALLCAFEAAVAANQPFDFYCGNQQFVDTITSCSAMFPHITVHPWTEASPNGTLVRAARKAASALNPASTLLPTQNQHACHRVVATDGSTGNLSFKGQRAVSGWAWISESGEHQTGTVDGANILLAELTAIQAAISATPNGTSLTVLTDSQNARNIAMNLLDEGKMHSACPASLRQVAAHLRRDATGKDITITWVRGHSGHALNDGADRLALNARRCAQSGTPDDVAAQVRARIVADTLSNAQTTQATA